MRPRRCFRFLFAGLLGCGLLASAPTSALADEGQPAAPERVTPLARAHAHNDYEHDRPLFDALSHGFTSVEADIWLVEGTLLVGHDRVDLEPERTLRSLYLDPLSHRVRHNHGRVYPGSDAQLQLLIDIKSAGAPTYRALGRVLRRYRGMLTKFTPGPVRPGAVSVVISGNRPRELMEDQRVRYAGYDGRLTDLGSGTPASFMPLISDRWTDHFSWSGVGPMPPDERRELHRIVRRAHAGGHALRFWATPDEPGPAREAVWEELVTADVDHINTDDLAGLERFLRTHDQPDVA